MAEKQAPKRPRADQSNEPSKKRKKEKKAEEQENINPLQSAGSPKSPKPGPSSVLRAAESSVKPDTPAILSVKSRIQKLSDQVVVKSVVDMFEKQKSQDPKPASIPEPLKLDTEGISAVSMKLFNQPRASASLSSAIRLRTEREAEVASLCGTFDPKNLWVKAMTTQQNSRPNNLLEMVPSSAEGSQDNDQAGEGTSKSALVLQSTEDSTESHKDSSISDELGDDQLPNVSEEPFVSSLEIHLKAYSSENALDAKKRTSSPRKVTFASQSETIPSITYEDGDSISSISPRASENESDQPEDHTEMEQHGALNNSAMLDQIFRGVLDREKSEPEENAQDELQDGLPPFTVLSPLGKSLNLESVVTPLNSVVSSLPELSEASDENTPTTSTPVSSYGDAGPPYSNASVLDTTLMSSEKRVSLLNMLTHLKSAESLGSSSPQSVQGLEPCRGSVTISDLSLPLNMDYLCSVMNRTGKPSHYFLLLIRFGSHYIVATPLASVQDALSGDAIIFPTSVTLNDAASSFEIDIEVYSLAQNGVIPKAEKRKSARSKITPKKLLSARKTSFASPAFSSPTGSSIRTSNFLLVGYLTVSRESLNKTKFPLDKMKFEGKVGRLLGAYFQDKVPFLSPLEGNIHLKLQCQSHSNVHHSGFLTMFYDVSGFGAWHRRWCVLSRNYLSYWAYPEQEKTMDPLGQINLFNCTSPQIEAASWEFCARPNTLEFITVRPRQEEDTETLVTQCHNTQCFSKNWLSADTKDERNQWLELLNQALVDLRTWRTTSDKVTMSPRSSQTEAGLSPQSSQTEAGPSLMLQGGPNDSGISVATNWEQANPTTSNLETEC
ncbi:uncharacterized protein LOC144798063 [Lissotriton helveticus]